MQLVLQLPHLIPLGKRPLSGHQTPEPASGTNTHPQLHDQKAASLSHTPAG